MPDDGRISVSHYFCLNLKFLRRYGYTQSTLRQCFCEGVCQLRIFPLLSTPRALISCKPQRPHTAPKRGSSSGELLKPVMRVGPKRRGVALCTVACLATTVACLTYSAPSAHIESRDKDDLKSRILCRPSSGRRRLITNTTAMLDKSSRHVHGIHLTWSPMSV